jgi:putative (di)nucleoside polyphosphate hydrolase
VIGDPAAAYRPNVGAALFNARGKVLVCRRADLPAGVADRSGWQLPQGGIDPGEDPRAAVLRELAEEIGTARAEILAEHDEWLTYDFPAHLRQGAMQRYVGQRQRWFALRFLGSDADIRFDTHHAPEFDAFRWVDLAGIPDLAVEWKRPVYEAVAAAFARFAG